jgi:hypothetical protein
MYSFFALSGHPSARLAVAATGSLIITAVLMVSSIVSANPATATLTTGALA